MRVVVEERGLSVQLRDAQRHRPSQHIGAGRAVAGGLFGLRAIANADARDIGFAWDSLSRVTLREGEAGRWYGGTPPGCEG